MAGAESMQILRVPHDSLRSGLPFAVDDLSADHPVATAQAQQIGGATRSAHVLEVRETFGPAAAANLASALERPLQAASAIWTLL